MEGREIWRPVALWSDLEGVLSRSNSGRQIAEATNYGVSICSSHSGHYMRKPSVTPPKIGMGKIEKVEKVAKRAALGLVTLSMQANCLLY